MSGWLFTQSGESESFLCESTKISSSTLIAQFIHSVSPFFVCLAIIFFACEQKFVFCANIFSIFFSIVIFPLSTTTHTTTFFALSCCYYCCCCCFEHTYNHHTTYSNIFAEDHVLHHVQRNKLVAQFLNLLWDRQFTLLWQINNFNTSQVVLLQKYEIGVEWSAVNACCIGGLNGLEGSL